MGAGGKSHTRCGQTAKTAHLANLLPAKAIIQAPTLILAFDPTDYEALLPDKQAPEGENEVILCWLCSFPRLALDS